MRTCIGVFLFFVSGNQAVADCKVVTTPIASVAVPSQMKTRVRRMSSEDSFVWELTLGRERVLLDFGFSTDLSGTEDSRKIRDPLEPSMFLTVRRADHSKLDLDGLVKRGLSLGPAAKDVVLVDIRQSGSTWKGAVFGPLGAGQTLESGALVTRFGGKLTIESPASAYINEYRQNGIGGWDVRRTVVPIARREELTELHRQQTDIRCDWFNAQE